MLVHMTKVIYDFGSNNGDDIPYYLKKSDLVVAVEANPTLCGQIHERFAPEIAKGTLVVENCVLTTQAAASDVSFWIHKGKPVLSQFPRPSDAKIGDYEEVLLPPKSAVEIVTQHGDPFYIKIDIEHSDASILRSLLLGGIRPPFISAESHTIKVFALLVSMGGYDSFNLVDGGSVAKAYENHLIRTNAGEDRYSFPSHSAGPFGEDIKGEWMAADDFFRFLAFENLGWKDVKLSAPVFAGDTIYAESEVLEVRESRSRPGQGIVRVRTRGFNQDDVTVMQFERAVLVYSRAGRPR